MPHIHEKYDFVITVFIVYGDKVLLVHHPRYDKWIPMGGHIELDEDPEEALFREIKEETGLEVQILAEKPSITQHDTKFVFAPRYIDVHEANPPHKHIALVYFAKAKNDKHTMSDEHSDIRWLNLDDLNNPEYKLSDSVKFYCREAIKSVIKHSA
jgi:8-oxo-dGTP pyrophosphatase MutT (NUDIX family)